MAAKPGARASTDATNALARSSSCQHPLPAGISGQQVGEVAVDPLQHRGPQQQRICSLCRSNTSSSRYSATSARCRRTRPRTAQGRHARERQRGQPQPGRPALRPLSSEASAESGSGVPANPAALALRPGRSADRPRTSSVSSPSSRELVQPQPQSRAGSQARSEGPAGRDRHQLQLGNVSSQASSCRSSSSARAGPRPRSRSASSRSTIVRRSGPDLAYETDRSRGRAGVVRHGSPATESQNRPGSSSCRSTDTHAVLSARPSSSTQERNSTVLPLPAGVDTKATRPARSSRPKSLPRGTSPIRTGVSTGLAVVPRQGAESTTCAAVSNMGPVCMAMTPPMKVVTTYSTTY